MIDAPALTDRLTDAAQSDADLTFTGDEQTVRDWLTEQPIDEYERAARDQITGRTVALDDDVNGHTLREIIEAHNDDPDAFDAGYVIDAGRTIVQYRHREASGKPPIAAADAEDAMADHIDDLVQRAVWEQIFPDARERFFAEA